MPSYRVEVFAPHYGVSVRFINADTPEQGLAHRLTKGRGLPAAGRGYAVVIPISWDADHWCDHEPVVFFKWSLGGGAPTIRPTRDQRVLRHRHAERYARRPAAPGRSRALSCLAARRQLTRPTTTPVEVPAMRYALTIDFAQLREQKAALRDLIGNNGDHPLMGLIHLLDAVPDQAVDVHGLPEVEVFGVVVEQ